LSLISVTGVSGVSLDPMTASISFPLNRSPSRSEAFTI
jgi:hypothetical protein